MTSELRQELERQYERATAAAAEKSRQQSSPDNQPAENAADTDQDYLSAPRSYKKEYAESFKSLPPEMRRYLHERESETERGFSRINNELNNRRWVDEVFAPRAERLGRLGISKAKDWVETMARIDDALETDPLGTLQTLAGAYGVSLDTKAPQNSNPGAEIAPLLERLEALDSKFSQFADDFKARSHDAEQIAESKKAREASFAPKGKNSNRDLSQLSTREVLELKLAEYE